MMNTKSKQVNLLVLGLSLGFALQTSAQKQAPPEGGPAKAFTVPAHETYTLPNGLKVTLIPYGIIPKVAIDIDVVAGSADEGRSHQGVADMTADLLKEGTEKLSSSQLADEAARMGSTLSVSSSYDRTDAELDVLSDFGADAVRLLADVVAHPRLPESELERLKTDKLRQIALAQSQPQTIAVMRFRKILYGDHPYSVILPAEADVRKITLQDINGYVSSNFNPKRTRIYVAGRFDVPAVKKAITESLGTWNKTGAARAEHVPAPNPQRVLDVTDRSGAPQSTIMIGLPVPAANSTDAIPLLVTNALLGGSFNSRITANIREQKGYTYSPRSQMSNRFHDAYWAESADVTTKFTGASLKEIVSEINRLAAEPPTDAELKGIQSYLSGVFVLQNSSRSALIGQLLSVDALGLGDDYLKTYVARVNSVTPADVQKMSAQYLKPASMTIVVVGDKSKITEELAPFEAGKTL
jgi:predicted Zn-dependent peptidase